MPHVSKNEHRKSLGGIVLHVMINVVVDRFHLSRETFRIRKDYVYAGYFGVTLGTSHGK